MTSQGWKSLLTPESSALTRFRMDPKTWPELLFQPMAAESGPARRGGARPVPDPAGAVRTQLLWAIQYDWQPGDLPLLRFLLDQQILMVEHAGEQTTEGLDDLSRAVRLVARGREEADVLQLYHAVHLLITNPVQPDQSWVSYYSELASLQSGMNQPDDLLGATAGGPLGGLAESNRPSVQSIQASSSTSTSIYSTNSIYSSGIRRGIPRSGADDSNPGSSGIRRARARRTSPQSPGADYARSFAPIGLGQPATHHEPGVPLTSAAPASPIASATSPITPIAAPPNVPPVLPILPATPPVIPPILPPVIPPVVPSTAESAPGWASGPGVGLLAEPAGDPSIESQVSRAFMAGGPEPAASVISEWAANRPENFESLNTQAELYASLGEYTAAADAARRLVALPDPTQPDPEMARFEALRRVARLERQSGRMDAAWRCLAEAQQHLGEHPHWREFGPGQSLATEYFLLAAALDPEEPLARAALKTGDKLTRKLAMLDEYLRQVALRAAEHCADDRLRRRYSRPIP
jgi:hypothetical protein